jgi:hypothetical protein
MNQRFWADDGQYRSWAARRQVNAKRPSGALAELPPSPGHKDGTPTEFHSLLHDSDQPGTAQRVTVLLQEHPWLDYAVTTLERVFRSRVIECNSECLRIDRRSHFFIVGKYSLLAPSTRNRLLVEVACRGHKGGTPTIRPSCSERQFPRMPLVDACLVADQPGAVVHARTANK